MYAKYKNLVALYTKHFSYLLNNNNNILFILAEVKAIRPSLPLNQEKENRNTRKITNRKCKQYKHHKQEKKREENTKYKRATIYNTEYK